MLNLKLSGRIKTKINTIRLRETSMLVSKLQLVTISMILLKVKLIKEWLLMTNLKSLKLKTSMVLFLHLLLGSFSNNKSKIRKISLMQLGQLSVEVQSK